MPTTNENRLPRPKLRSVNERRSTIGCLAVSTRAKKTTADRPDTQASSNTVSSPNQSLRGPSSSTYSSAPRKPAIDSSPTQSKLRNSDQSGSSKSISTKAATVTAIPGTTLMKNSQCQEKASVRYPPTVGPIVGAKVATKPIIGDTMLILERGKIR